MITVVWGSFLQILRSNWWHCYTKSVLKELCWWGIGRLREFSSLSLPWDESTAKSLTVVQVLTIAHCELTCPLTCTCLDSNKPLVMLLLLKGLHSFGLTLSLSKQEDAKHSLLTAHCQHWPTTGKIWSFFFLFLFHLTFKQMKVCCVISYIDASQMLINLKYCPDGNFLCLPKSPFYEVLKICKVLIQLSDKKFKKLAMELNRHFPMKMYT